MLVHSDLLDCMTSVRALNKVIHESVSYKNEQILNEDKRKGACIKANNIMISCLCSSKVRLVSRASCNIAIRESTNDESAKDKANKLIKKID